MSGGVGDGIGVEDVPHSAVNCCEVQPERTILITPTYPHRSYPSVSLHEAFELALDPNPSNKHISRTNRAAFAFLLLSCSLPFATASSTLNSGRCCMKSARAQLELLHTVPWLACGINQTNINPSVEATMRWCLNNCPGYQLSSWTQWSDLVTTFIVPAIALLVICPIGSRESLLVELRRKHKSWIERVPYSLREYIMILGDPASALAGCFYQLWMDFLMVWKMPAVMEKEQEERSTEWWVRARERDARGFAILAGQTRLEDENGKESELRWLEDWVKGVGRRDPEKAEAIEGGSDTRQAPEPKNVERANGIKECVAEPVVADIEKNENTAVPLPDQLFGPQLHQTMHTIYRAKIDFVNGVGAPVVLTFAGSAAGFYGAYTQLGDRDKAYSLAYGVWFAWLLVLSVVSNCYATTVNTELLESSLDDLTQFCHPEIGGSRRIHFKVVPFRKRVLTWNKWKAWVASMMREHADPKFDRWFYLRFGVVQMAGWICVGFFCACATAIAYKTPTVGIGCRSFNFILYGILAFILAWLLVLRDFASCNGWTITGHILRAIYGTLASANAFVLVGGTTFHLVGLFRNCRCQGLFMKGDALVELSINTRLDLDNAKKYWISVGYLAFTGAWCICVLAVGFREYIYLRLGNRFHILRGVDEAGVSAAGSPGAL